MSETMTATKLHSKKLADYRPYPYEIIETDLHFTLDPKQTKVEARTQFKARSACEPMVLDGKNLILKNVEINGIALNKNEYSISESRLEIFHPPSAGELYVVTEINPVDNTSLSGLYMSKEYFCTQCEAEGFRSITYFPDRPDVLCRYTTRVTADMKALPIVLSNGDLVSADGLDKENGTVVWHDPHPKPSYLFALVAGRFDVIEDEFVTGEGRHVRLAIHTEAGKAKYATWAMECLKKAMRWDEKRYGRYYDLDVFNIVAVNDFNFGAMENKGLNIFNDKYLLVDKSIATDRDYENVEAIVAHEYFHNWTGNRITCRDWFQLCLKEGLTVYREQQFCADERGADVMRIRDVNRLQISQFPEDNGPLSHPVRPESYSEINNFYTATVYEKGAEIIHMLHTWMGDDAYYAGIKTYFDRFDGQAVTIEDFLQALGDGGGVDTSGFLSWYTRSRTPNIKITARHDEQTWRWHISRVASPSISACEATQQANTELDDRLLPLKYAIFSGDKLEAVKSELLLMKDQTTSIVMEKAPHSKFVPILSLNRGFSAPVIIDDQKGFTKLAKAESDPYKRWEAVKELQCRLIASYLGDDNVKLETCYRSAIDAIASVLDNTSFSDRMRALLLDLPAQDILISRLRPYNPHQLDKAIQRTSEAIVKECHDQLRRAYANISIDPHYSPDPAQCGKRALRYTLLRYLDKTDQGLALELYKQSNNMTDKLSALTLVAERSSNDELINALCEEFCHEPLVIDSINAIRARTRRIDTPQIVKGIYWHPNFSRSNPNRLYALIGSLSTNLCHFHDTAGWGYSLLKEVILSNDETNSQLSARFARILARWQDIGEPYREQQHKTLLEILNTPSLSTETTEIVSKALGSQA